MLPLICRAGYKAILISTIVDAESPLEPICAGYKAILISTIVDCVVCLVESELAIKPF